MQKVNIFLKVNIDSEIVKGLKNPAFKSVSNEVKETNDISFQSNWKFYKVLLSKILLKTNILILNQLSFLRISKQKRRDIYPCANLDITFYMNFDHGQAEVLKRGKIASKTSPLQARPVFLLFQPGLPPRKQPESLKRRCLHPL